MDRDIERFWYCVLAGLVAVAYNADHILCAVVVGIPLLPLSGLYGCKATPEVTFNIALSILWITGALVIGLIGKVAYRAIRKIN